MFVVIYDKHTTVFSNYEISAWGFPLIDQILSACNFLLYVAILYKVHMMKLFGSKSERNFWLLGMVIIVHRTKHGRSYVS